ncbi:hypothetical protein EG338_12360 [Kaistella haifensis]|nr:hypothetical protein EG338_12360 [Kaistella haifensis]
MRRAEITGNAKIQLAVSLVTLLFLSAILFIDPVTRFFKVTTLSASEIGFAALVAFASVIWFEGFKLWKRMRKSEGLLFERKEERRKRKDLFFAKLIFPQKDSAELPESVSLFQQISKI